jgi:hypothetical protein
VSWDVGATLGAVAIGLGLLIWNVIVWWPGRKALMKDPVSLLGLGPFLFGFCFGSLAAMCGGALGYVADATLWAGGWAGDAGLIWGVGGFREDVTRGGAQALTNGGLVVVLLLCFVFFAVLRRKEATRSQVRQGAVSGIMLGTVKGVAGLMAIPLASLVNLAGAWLSTGVLH